MREIRRTNRDNFLFSYDEKSGKKKMFLIDYGLVLALDDLVNIKDGKKTFNDYLNPPQNSNSFNTNLSKNNSNNDDN